VAETPEGDEVVVEVVEVAAPAADSELGDAAES
jgi:hypothetical protein